MPADQEEEFRALWEEFEAYETPEAKFAHVCDNMQPFMLNSRDQEDVPGRSMR